MLAKLTTLAALGFLLLPAFADEDPKDLPKKFKPLNECNGTYGHYDVADFAAQGKPEEPSFTFNLFGKPTALDGTDPGFVAQACTLLTLDEYTPCRDRGTAQNSNVTAIISENCDEDGKYILAVNHTWTSDSGVVLSGIAQYDQLEFNHGRTDDYELCGDSAKAVNQKRKSRARSSRVRRHARVL